jgi:hypothetical protein
LIHAILRVVADGRLETASMIYRAFVLLASAAALASVGAAFAQGIPGPLPFPSNGAAPITPGASAPHAESCMGDFAALRAEAETRGKMIKTASDRHAGADEACELIANYGQAEDKMIRYVEINASKCGIPAQVSDQLRVAHKNTEGLLTKACNAAQSQARGVAGSYLSDVLGSSASVPRKGPIGDFGHLINRQIP